MVSCGHSTCRARRLRNLNDAANRFIPPRDDRIVHLMENRELGAARVALVHVCGKVARFFSRRFPVQIRHQVFGPMTNWSLVLVLHDTSSAGQLQLLSTTPSPRQTSAGASAIA